MRKMSVNLKDFFVTVIILCLCFGLCLDIHQMFEASALIPAIIVLSVFLISLLTEKYIWGIISSVISVVAVNFAFTFPYFGFDFRMPENIISCLVLLAVTVVTCGLTTRMKKQELIRAQGEKERMRANLLRAISHDLRTPLTTIYGSSSALLEDYDSFSEEQRKQMIGGIKKDAQWLNRMVENLLFVTRIDGGKVDIYKLPTVLDELVDSVLMKFRKRYPNQAVEVDIPADFVIIPMDAMLISQVLVNILENAVQHAKGMTRLSLKVYVSSGKAAFEIRDDGCGIKPEKLKTIFSGYSPSGDEPSDGKRNAGIGLSVCASILRAHGGEIGAKNLKGGGCMFWFILDMEDFNDGE